MSDLTIRSMTRAEVDLAIDWAAAEGWNPGLTDAAPFHAADPDGFLVGTLAGEPVAMISAVRYGASFGFIGLYIARPDRRGQGHGWAVWQAGMARLAGRNVGLDGVVAQQDNYRQSGFVLAHRNARYAGQTGPVAHVAPAGQRIVALARIPMDALLRYDRAFFPEPREAFLRAWVAQPGSVALGLVDASDGWSAAGDSGAARPAGLADAAPRLTGYGVIRPCRSGYKIGPLFADTADGAEALFGALAAAVAPGQPLFLDVSVEHAEAVALATRHGMQPVFETARMYTGPAPDLSPARSWGITSFELG